MTLPKETPMIERLAVLLCEQRGHNPYSTCDIMSPDDPDAIYAWAGFRNEAREVLTALRDPTPEMLAQTSFVEGSNEFPKADWQAMIDRALTEGEGHD